MPSNDLSHRGGEEGEGRDKRQRRRTFLNAPCSNRGRGKRPRRQRGKGRNWNLDNDQREQLSTQFEGELVRGKGRTGGDGATSLRRHSREGAVRGGAISSLERDFNKKRK